MSKAFLTSYEYECPGDYESIYAFLERKHDYSSRVFKSIIRKGKLTLNGRDARFIEPIKASDKLCVFFPLEEADAAAVESNINIIYEDEDILIVNKDANVIVHPTRSHQDDTLSNFIYYHWQQTGFKGKARFVSRLDRDTTGAVIIAKNKYVHHFIQNQSIKGETDKTYLCLVRGVPKEKQGIIDLPISRTGEGAIQREVNDEGKQCLTQYKVISEYKNASLVEVKLLTGRTHQIRVHFAHMGFPLLGDTLYNQENESIISRQALHAYTISFVHPRTEKRLTFSAPIPADFLKAQEILKGEKL